MLVPFSCLWERVEDVLGDKFQQNCCREQVKVTPVFCVGAVLGTDFISTDSIAHVNLPCWARNDPLVLCRTSFVVVSDRIWWDSVIRRESIVAMTVARASLGLFHCVHVAQGLSSCR